MVIYKYLYYNTLMVCYSRLNRKVDALKFYENADKILNDPHFNKKYKSDYEKMHKINYLLISDNEDDFEKAWKENYRTKADYDKFDILLCMDDSNMRNIKWIIPSDPQEKIHKLMTFAGSNASVADPWYTGDFETTYKDILKGCEGLLEYLLNE